jgi:hemerythrin-like domain-containing protein
MKPTEKLSKEHQSILTLTGILARLADRLETGAPVDPADIERTLEFIRVVAQRCHRAKEEDFLFPALEKAGLERGGPIAMMLAEHAATRTSAEAMAESLPGVRSGDEPAVVAFAAAARRYRDVLAIHIAKEDRILYPLADSRLTPEDQAALERSFDEIEESVVGAGLEEEYRRLLNRLERTYVI